MKTYRYTLLIVLLLVSHVLHAQPPITRIDGVYIERDTAWTPLHKTQVVNGDVIVFDIPGIGEYLGESDLTVSDIVLQMDSIPVKEFPAYIEDYEAGIVKFIFAEDGLSIDTRQHLYNSAGGTKKKFKLGVKVGDEFTLSYYKRATFCFPKVKFWSWVGIILIGSFFLFFVVIIRRFPSLVKVDVDSVAAQAALGQPGPSVAPLTIQTAAYSFGKSQLAFWTFIVIASYIYIWVFTWDLNSINTTALVLIGISALTIAATSTVNNSDESAASQNANVSARLTRNRTTSGGFFTDIMSDLDGPSIHRFQCFVFNVLFGLAFAKSVVFDYTMPTFSETQLLLLGLSNGTYAFLKRNENK